jgi:ubiquinone/menaquinone biosynthesis C-methylase UbiE
MNHGILDARYSHGELVRKYNRIASVYDLFGIFMASKARHLALEMASIQNGERVLEVALGTGLNFAEILKRNPDGWVQGIDISTKMLERTKKRIARIEHEQYALHLCDCRHLPFEDGAFDIVINEYMLDILPVEDFSPVLSEFKRVLRNGGRIVLVNTTNGEKWVNRIYEQLYKLRPPIVAGSRGVRAQPFLKEAGFNEIQRVYTSQFGFPSEVVRGYKR